MYTWITSLINSFGYVGIAFLMFIENVFPPIPSELIMIFAGISSTSEELNIFWVIVAGSIGSTIGLLPWFYLAKLLGQDRFKKFIQRNGRWLTITNRDIDKTERYFHKYKEQFLFFGRFLPGLRTLVAVPAGLFKVSVVTLMLYGFLGAMVWDAVFAVLGYYLGQQAEQIAEYLDIATWIALVAIIVWYIYRVIRHKS